MLLLIHTLFALDCVFVRTVGLLLVPAEMSPGGTADNTQCVSVCV